MTQNKNQDDDVGGGSDWLDSMCGGASDAMCPLPNQDVIAQVDAVEPKPGEKDVLDRVFTRVESYSCTGGDDENDGDKNNTMVWPSNSGASSSKDPSAASAQALASGSASRSASGEENNNTTNGDAGIMMQEGDALDRVFERVESLVCSFEADTTAEDEYTLSGDAERQQQQQQQQQQGQLQPAGITAVSSNDKGDGTFPDLESGATSSSIETTQQDYDKDANDNNKLWCGRTPTCISLCCLGFCVVVAALVVNSVLYFTRWQD